MPEQEQGRGYVYKHPAAKYIDSQLRYSVLCTCGWSEKPQLVKQQFCGGCGVKLVDGTYSHLLVD